MTADLTTSCSITIRAAAEDVWEALTTPNIIERWFFGVDTVTDWTEGSPIVHTGVWQGRPYEDKGHIVRIEPPRLLVHTHWSPLSGLPDAPEHYQEVTWSISEHGSSTEVTVSETNLPSEDAKRISEETWPVVLGKLKTVVES